MSRSAEVSRNMAASRDMAASCDIFLFRVDDSARARVARGFSRVSGASCRA